MIKHVLKYLEGRLTPEEKSTIGTHLGAHRAGEEKAILEKIPEWKDPKRAQAEMAGIRAALVQQYGIHPGLVEDFPHHQGVLIARDALKARSLQAELDKMKATQAQQAKAAKAEAAGQGRHEDFKRRLEDVRRSKGGKQDRREMIADYVDGEK